VISPSGAMFYEGELFPWKDNLVLGGLSEKGLIRLTLEGGRVASEERLDLQHRIRDVIEAPDGAVLVITDEQAASLLRLTPLAAAQ
jgi:glucose/arabinose dehydrogenase